MRVRISLVGLLGMVVCGACGEGMGGGAFSVRDSAGIAIAESHAPRWRPGEGWRIDSEPALRIGVADGDSLYQFQGIGSVTRLANGDIVVGERSNRIRIFGAGGTWKRSFGGRGGGPGEFGSLGIIRVVVGDSLFAYDSGRREVHIFDAVEGYRRSVRIESLPQSSTASVRTLPDGRFVAHLFTYSVPSFERPLGVHADDNLVTLHAPTGELLDTLGVFPGWEVDITSIEGGGTAISGAMFGRATTIDTHGDRIYVGTARSMEILVYTPAGSLERIVRFPGADLRLREDEIAAYRAAILAKVRDGELPAFFEHRLRQMTVPEQKAAYSRILLDSDGCVWTSPWEDFDFAAGSWSVFDPDGRLLGTVDIPLGLRVKEIGADYVLGVWKDDLGVEYVQLHRLHRE